jgi:hypothetical protein
LGYRFGLVCHVYRRFGFLFDLKIPKRAGKRKLAIWLAPVPNVIANTLILPPIIKWVYGDAASPILIAVLVLAGELVSSGAGIPLAFALDRHARNILEH